MTISYISLCYKNGFQDYISMVGNVTDNYVSLERFMNAPTVCQAVKHNVDCLISNTANVSSTEN